MLKNTQYQPGQSGNPETQFKPANVYRWKKQQSGNPAGRATKRLRVEHFLVASLVDHGITREDALRVLEGVGKREASAVAELLEYLLPLTAETTLTGSKRNE